jgi:hypothetical protein
MAFSDFSFEAACQKFSLHFEQPTPEFAASVIEPSAPLRALLKGYVQLATTINTEKARSEFLIAPLLADFTMHFRSQVSLFSDAPLNVDAEAGLTGFCDFLISRDPNALRVTAPVVVVVEAKREDIIGGLGQCVAELVAARMLNEREKKSVPVLLGAVTSGTNWRFLRLEGNTVTLDSQERFISEPQEILGLLATVL